MGKYTHLTEQERREIYQLRQKGHGVRSIARSIQRDKGTISRELKRNDDELGYLPDTANKKYAKRRTHRKKKIYYNSDLSEYIVSKLKEKWSPEQISGRMRVNKLPFYASVETIYSFIYSEEGKWLGLYHFLRYKHAKRGQIYGRKYRAEKIPNRISIHDRPKQISLSPSVGDFEGDLTFFRGNQSANLTVLVDKKSILTLLVKNASKKSDEVISGIMNRTENIALKSVTFDNGVEFTQHTRLNLLRGVKTYFCDPGSPWQKATVENTISRLHRYIRKDWNLLRWTDRQIADVEYRLNSTPRKKLGFLTPFEVFNAEIGGVALHS